MAPKSRSIECSGSSPVVAGFPAFLSERPGSRLLPATTKEMLLLKASKPEFRRWECGDLVLWVLDVVEEHVVVRNPHRGGRRAGILHRCVAIRDDRDIVAA